MLIFGSVRLPLFHEVHSLHTDAVVEVWHSRIKVAVEILLHYILA